MHKNKYSILETISLYDLNDINDTDDKDNKDNIDIIDDKDDIVNIYRIDDIDDRIDRIDKKNITNDIANDITNNNQEEKNLNFRSLKLNKYYNKKKTINNYNYNSKVNHKKIMCQNFIDNNICIYMDKCLYAHNLQEQIIDIKRKKIFELLDSIDVLPNIDYITHKEIYKELNIFTKLCNDCINNKCTGGFNCKFGSPLQKYLVCYDDLNYGNCKDNNCNRIHLTKKGFNPQYNNISKKINNSPISNMEILYPFMNNINNLLINISNNNDDNLENDDLENDDINNILSDDECLNSIFIEKFIFDD